MQLIFDMDDKCLAAFATTISILKTIHAKMTGTELLYRESIQAQANEQMYIFVGIYLTLTVSRAHGQASEELRNNKEVVMEAVSQKGRALKYASDSIKVPNC